MSEENERKKYAWTELDEDTHRQLCRWATKLGTHPSDLIAIYIADGLARHDGEKEKEEEPSLELRAYATVQGIRGGTRLRVMLKQIAWQCLQSSDEALYDELVVLCEEAKVSVEVILGEVRNYEGIPIVAYDDGHGVVSAMSWLQDTIERGKEYPMREVVRSGSLQGFSKHVLKDAKQKLGIVSERRSKHWVWRWADTIDALVEEE